MASSSVAAHVLMKKGKRGAAAYVHADCSNSAYPQHLNELLDLLLNPGKTIDDWETIDWCKWLIAGGRTPDEFASNEISINLKHFSAAHSIAANNPNDPNRCENTYPLSTDEQLTLFEHSQKKQQLFDSVRRVFSDRT
uniref:(California timema) hypothetical protein n=1 Tax=Timema californicum TaxID=61474 RepID=A0A7R9J742_TIMCA|nr:unnamed protein product [Timema californicum]